MNRDEIPGWFQWRSAQEEAVHLDARHDREHLTADIRAWLPKVRVGGWLSGDDYDPVKWPNVMQTINDVLPGAESWSTSQWRWIVR